VRRGRCSTPPGPGHASWVVRSPSEASRCLPSAAESRLPSGSAARNSAIYGWFTKSHQILLQHQLVLVNLLFNLKRHLQRAPTFSLNRQKIPRPKHLSWNLNEPPRNNTSPEQPKFYVAAWCCSTELIQVNVSRLMFLLFVSFHFRRVAGRTEVCAQFTIVYLFFFSTVLQCLLML